MKEKSKKMKYVLCIYQYGITPFLLLMQEYEDLENYEECHVMMEAINHVNQFFHSEELLETKYTEKTLEEFKSVYKKDVDMAIEMIPVFMEEIKKYVL